MQESVVKTSIFEAAIRFHESLDAGDCVALAIELLPALIQSDSVAILLKSEESERLELVRATNATLAPVGPFVDLCRSSTPVVQAINERRVIITNDCAQKSGGQSLHKLALLCAPMVAGNRLIGAVQLARRCAETLEPMQSFTAEEGREVEFLCDSLARAIRNAIDYHVATRQTLVDDLTRLYNVRYLYQSLDAEIKRARRYGSSVSIVFMDLDGFKLINDAYGHRAGSVTLTEVAEVIAMSVRESDFVARYGGDEFVLMLPETSAQQAAQMAERVRAALARYRFTGGVGAEIYLTASFGVASFPEHGSETERLIELADAAMYEAKQHSKNTVRVAAS